MGRCWGCHRIEFCLRHGLQCLGMNRRDELSTDQSNADSVHGFPLSQRLPLNARDGARHDSCWRDTGQEVGDQTWKERILIGRLAPRASLLEKTSKQPSCEKPKSTPDFVNINDSSLIRILDAGFDTLADIDSMHHVVPRGFFRKTVDEAVGLRSDVACGCLRHGLFLAFDRQRQCKPGMLLALYPAMGLPGIPVKRCPQAHAWAGVCRLLRRLSDRWRAKIHPSS